MTTRISIAMAIAVLLLPAAAFCQNHYPNDVHISSSIKVIGSTTWGTAPVTIAWSAPDETTWLVAHGGPHGYPNESEPWSIYYQLAYYKVVVDGGTASYTVYPSQTSYSLSTIGLLNNHTVQIQCHWTLGMTGDGPGGSYPPTTDVTSPTTLSFIPVSSLIDLPAVMIHNFFEASSWYKASVSCGWIVDVTTPQEAGIDAVASTYQILYSPNSGDGTQAAPCGSAVSLGTGSLRSISEQVSSACSSGDGYYFLSVHAVSVLGQDVDQLCDAPFKYDATAPAVTKMAAVLSSDGMSIDLSWAATDHLSGVADCTLSYVVSGVATTVPASAISSAYSATITISPDLYGNTVTFSVVAVDNAGNESQAQSVSVSVPPQIAMSARVVPYGEGSTATEQVDQPYMEVDLDFGLAPAELKSFSSLRVTRTLADGSSSAVTLPARAIDPSTIPDDVSTGSASPDGLPWKLGANGDVIYADYIPVSSGAGHKSWSYALVSAIYGATGASWGAITNPVSPIALPNNRGSVNWSTGSVFDMQGNAYGASGFTVGATGEVQVEITGNDSDGDAWNIEVDKVTQVTQPTSGGGSYTFTSYRPLSGKDQIFYPAPYGNKMVSVNLSLGDNNIEVSWIEGGTSTVMHSRVIDLVLKQSAGVYTLTVSDGYGNQVSGSGGGLVCSPGQSLTFAVSASDASDTAGIAWDFGDGSDGAIGASVAHAYHQGVNQTTCSVDRTLTMRLPTSVTVQVPITVQDTQEGTLYESEVWHGDHTVPGVVIVPQGMSLTIASGTVSFEGDLAAGYGQGITVAGDLQITGGVALQAASGQSEGWGSVVVEGTATIGSGSGEAVVIEGADRGVAAADGATLALVNTRLVNNLTGIQVVGTRSVTITGCSITGNSVYGVKEDSGGRPVLIGTTIGGNFRDYYQWDGGLLTIDQINELGTNSGNKGEQHDSTK